MDAELYDKKMSEMTNDENTYKKLYNNIDRRIQKKIINLTENITNS